MKKFYTFLTITMLTSFLIVGCEKQTSTPNKPTSHPNHPKKPPDTPCD